MRLSKIEFAEALGMRENDLFVRCIAHVQCAVCSRHAMFLDVFRLSECLRV